MRKAGLDRLMIAPHRSEGRLLAGERASAMDVSRG
jgi:hypothetical protein